jgi:hypothetical protein
MFMTCLWNRRRIPHPSEDSDCPPSVQCPTRRLLGHVGDGRVFTALCLTFLWSGQTTGEIGAGERSDHVLGQPIEHFYGAQGVGVRVRWELERDTVREGESLLITLVVERVQNPQQVQRPDLRKFELFARSFEWIEPQPPPEIDASSHRVRFPYRLRPRHRGVTEVPPLLFRYFNPSASEGRQYPLTIAKALPLRIIPAASPEGTPPLPLQAADSWFELIESDSATSVIWGQGPSGSVWIISLVMGPLLAWGWYSLWRRWFPDAQKLARLQRSRLARETVRQLRQVSRSSHPWDVLSAAVVHYIQQRWNLPAGCATAVDVVAAVRGQNIPDDLLVRIHQLLQDWEKLRFAPDVSTANVEQHVQAALELLLRLEEL